MRWLLQKAGLMLCGIANAAAGVSRSATPSTRYIDNVDDNADPMDNFGDFGINMSFDTDRNFQKALSGVVSYLRIIGFAMALTALVFIIIRYFITPNPHRREEMKSRAVTIGVLVMLLGAALVIADMFYSIAASVAG